MDPWSRWLFQEHTEAELRHWARRLHLFRFVRAYGGHANDGDELVAVYRYNSIPELGSALASIGIALVTHSSTPPQPVPGRSYSENEFDAFPSLIPGSRTEQPQRQQINGRPVWVWCSADRVRFAVAEGYDVNAHCVEHAERIEPALATLSLERIEPPVDRKHCICPKYYPDYFR